MQLTWYRTIEDFDRTHWWCEEKNGKVNFEHPELFWNQKCSKNSERRSYAPEPIFWEILRRHPDLGPAASWTKEKNALREAEKKGHFSMPVNPLTLRTQILWILQRLGGHSWPTLSQEDRLAFSENLSAFLKLDKFNRDKMRVAAGPSVADLSGDLLAQDIWDAYLPTFVTLPGRPTLMVNEELWSDPFTRLAPAVRDAISAGYEIMVLRIDPSEDNLDRIAEQFIRLYKDRLPKDSHRARVRPDKLGVISDAERSSEFSPATFGTLFAPFTLKVSNPRSPALIVPDTFSKRNIEKLYARTLAGKQVKKK